MDEKVFKENIAMLCVNFGLDDSHSYLKMIFHGLKNKVNNEKFKEVCEKIMRMTAEEFFHNFKGKKITYGDWMLVCGIQSENDLLDVNKARFLDHLAKYLSQGFIFKEQHDAFERSLSEFEKMILRRYGGLKDLWWSVSKENRFSRNTRKVMQEIEGDYDSSVRLDRSVERIENMGMVKRIEKLTGKKESNDE